MNRTTNLAVTLATQRSGTKSLGTCFNCGTEVLSLGEIFHDRNLSIVSFKNFVLANSDFSILYAQGRNEELLDRYFQQLSTLYKFVHFDYMYAQLGFMGGLWSNHSSKNSIFEFFKSREFSIIHLVRDPLDSYISLVSASRTGVFHETVDGSKFGEAASMRFEEEDVAKAISDFIEYRASVVQIRDGLRAGLKDYPHYIEVDYSDLFSGGFLNKSVSKSISEMLGPACKEDYLQCREIGIVKSSVTQTGSWLKEHLKQV